MFVNLILSLILGVMFVVSLYGVITERSGSGANDD